MNFLLPNPTGIDFYTQALQCGWDKKAKALWNVNSATYNSFGRVQRTKTIDGYVPEFYNPETQNYTAGTGNSNGGGMFFENSLAGFSFLGFEDPIKEVDGKCYAKARWFFFLDLSKITPGGLTPQQQAGQRLDELAINDIRNWVQAGGFNFQVIGEHRNIDKVLDWYSGETKRRALLDNMNNKLCFCIELKLAYYPGLETKQFLKIPKPEMYRSLVMFIKTSPDPTKIIQVGPGANTPEWAGQYVQQEYAPGPTLTPMAIGAANGYLAGKTLFSPSFYANDVIVSNPAFNPVIGVWDRTAQGGFKNGAVVVMNFQDWT